MGEISEVCCHRGLFERAPPGVKRDGLTAVAGDEMGEVDDDDASSFLFSFKDKKAMGYFEVTRNGTGNRIKTGSRSPDERRCNIQYGTHV